MKLRQTLLTVVAAAGLIAAPAFADDRHDHGADHDHGEEKHHFEVTTPANVKEAWALLVAKVAEAEAALAGGKLDVVHEAGEHIEAAVHTLQEKSDMVAADAKTKLASALKQLDKAADEMHHGAEEKNADEATVSLGKLKGLMPVVESLYPSGALK